MDQIHGREAFCVIGFGFSAGGIKLSMECCTGHSCFSRASKNRVATGKVARLHLEGLFHTMCMDFYLCSCIQNLWSQPFVQYNRAASGMAKEHATLNVETWSKKVS
jgi:hypothetical protein